MIIPAQKIKVFISSTCGSGSKNQKYRLVRAGIKALIESTHFAKVYLFEDEGASPLPAGQHYINALKESDVVIFLIDNKDDVSTGVQNEIDAANKFNIKSFYYFCDSQKKKETLLQKSLTGVKYAKTKVVHSFEEFIKNGAKDLIDDLVLEYRRYSKEQFELCEKKSNTGALDTKLGDSVDSFGDTVTKSIIANIDNCKNYFFNMITGRTAKTVTSTSALDQVLVGFLPVLFDGEEEFDEKKLKCIKAELQKQQEVARFSVTNLRYEAINEYFLDNSDICISRLEEALGVAHSESMPTWIIDDILIDLRNQFNLTTQNKGYSYQENKYQKQLNEKESLLCCPEIDRLNKDFYDRLVTESIKDKLQSLHTVHLGNDLASYTDLLACKYVVAMYYGSLTHLDMLYRQVMDLSFYCAEKYSNWNFKVMLLSTSIHCLSTKEFDGVLRYFGDVLCRLDAEDAKTIYLFANNQPIQPQRIKAKLEAFRVVGYFLSDEQFNHAWNEINTYIIEWVNNRGVPIELGNNIFAMLKDTHHRISQNQFAEFVCICFEKKLRRYYGELFETISKCISLKELSLEMVSKLLTKVIDTLKDPDERNNINNLSDSLLRLRIQNRELTEGLDKTISEFLPDFYKGDYLLYTAEDDNISAVLEENIAEINKMNEEQGKSGVYFGYVTKPHITIKRNLQQNDCKISDDLLNRAFKASFDTLMSESQMIDTKIDAIELLVYLIKSYSFLKDSNQDACAELLNRETPISASQGIMTNLNAANLKFCVLLLYACFGEDVSMEMIEIIANFDDDALAIENAGKSILSFLETDDDAVDARLESVILQNSIKWCNNSDYNIRWYAINILLQLFRNPINEDIVFNQLVKSMDSDNLYIKNRILRMAEKLGIYKKKPFDYILQKANLDANFVVRKVAREVSQLIENSCIITQ